MRRSSYCERYQKTPPEAITVAQTTTRGFNASNRFPPLRGDALAEAVLLHTLGDDCIESDLVRDVALVTLPSSGVARLTSVVISDILCVDTRAIYIRLCMEVTVGILVLRDESFVSSIKKIKTASREVARPRCILRVGMEQVGLTHLRDTARHSALRWLDTFRRVP